MSILVTRPTPDAEPLVQRLQTKGLRVLHAPMMRIKEIRITASAKAEFDQAIQNGLARLAFTSANGVRAILAQAPEAVQAPCFCVGEQTAQVARKAGFEQVIVSGGDVAHLTATIVQYSGENTAQWFHIRAQNHRGALVRALLEKGYNAHAICAYNAERVTALPQEVIAAVKAGEIRGVLLYSPRTARLFEQLLLLHGLAESCSRMRAYGLSKAVVAALQESWLHRWFPEQPDAQALEAQVIKEGRNDD